MKNLALQLAYVGCKGLGQTKHHVSVMQVTGPSLHLMCQLMDLLAINSSKSGNGNVSKVGGPQNQSISIGTAKIFTAPRNLVGRSPSRLSVAICTCRSIWTKGISVSWTLASEASSNWQLSLAAISNLCQLNFKAQDCACDSMADPCTCIHFRQPATPV